MKWIEFFKPQPSLKPVIESLQSIELRNVGYSYEGGAQVFDDFSVQLPMNENILVTGAPGNGQSTLLKILAALVQPQKGEVLFNGHNTTEMSFEEFLPIRMKIGYTFDYGGLFSNRTLRDNLALPLLYHKICDFAEAHVRVQYLAEEFSFKKQLDQRPAAVSGGLRKLACVLRAFVLSPEMIVMDDPFTGVDPESVRKLIRLVHKRRESGELKHIFFTSRDEVWAERLGYRALIIENGQTSLGPSLSEGKVG